MGDEKPWMTQPISCLLAAHQIVDRTHPYRKQNHTIHMSGKALIAQMKQAGEMQLLLISYG